MFSRHISQWIRFCFDGVLSVRCRCWRPMVLQQITYQPLSSIHHQLSIRNSSDPAKSNSFVFQTKDEWPLAEDREEKKKEWSKVAIQNWYPGHMAKAEREMKTSLRHVDLVLEVCDARAPLSSVNPTLRSVLGSHHQRIILYNKVDLAPDGVSQLVSEKESEIPRLFVQANRRASVRRILPFVLRQLAPASKKKGQQRSGFTIMIVGMPNVGKSTIVNAIRGTALRGETERRIAKTGPRPGVTRSLSGGILVNKEPRIHLLDTPGVFVPRLDDIDAAFRLALINAIPKAHVDPIPMLEYLMYHAIHSQQMLSFETCLSPKAISVLPAVSTLTHYEDFVSSLLDATIQYRVRPRHLNSTLSVQQELAASYLIEKFREGVLGKYCLDFSLSDDP